MKRINVRAKLVFRQALLLSALPGVFGLNTMVSASVIDWKPPVGGSIDWATGTNWDGGTVPGTLDIARFDQTTYTFQPTAGAISIAGIQIGDGTTLATSLTLTGSTITLGASGITMNANSAAANIQSGIILGDHQTWTNNSTATLSRNLNTGSGALDTNGKVLTVDGSGITALRYVVSGGGSIVKTGSGTLQLGFGAVNTFSGGVSIKAGVVQTNGISSTTFGPAALGTTGTVTLGDTTTGSTASATLMLSSTGGSGGNNLLPNPITVSSATSGTLLITGTTQLQTITGQIQLDHDLQLSATGTGLTLFGTAGRAQITGTKDLICMGGTVSLDGNTGTAQGNPNWSGNIKVKAGLFKLNNSNMNLWGSTVDRPVVNPGTVISIAAGASFDWLANKIAYAGINDQDGGGGSITTSSSAASGNINMNIAGSGTYSFSGIITDTATKAPFGLATALGSGGTQTLSNTANAYTGYNYFYGGVLAVAKIANGGSTSSIGSSTGVATNVVFNGGALRYTGGGDSSDRLFTIASRGGTLESSGAGALNLTNAGTLSVIDAAHNGTLTSGSSVISAVGGSTGSLFMFDLALGAQVYTGTGTTWTSLGTVTAFDQTAKSITLSAPYVGAGGAAQGLLFVANRTFTLGGSNSGDNTLSAALADGNSVANITAGLPTGKLSIVKSGGGKWILSAANTYTGSTSINAGKLSIASTGSINSTSGISIGAGELNYNSATALTPAITFTSTGGTLSGTGSIGSAVTVPAGNFVAPGSSIGTLTTVNIALNGTASMELSSSAVSADKLNATGYTITLGGTSVLSVADIAISPNLSLGQSYDLFDGTFSGTFGSISLPTLPTGLAWDQTALYTNGVISVQPAGPVVVNSNWNVNADGTWSTSGNWSAGVPTNSGDTANFTSAITAPRTVTVDSARTVSTINFNNSNKYTIGGTATLTVNAISAGAINVTSGSHEISAPLALAQDTTVTVTNSGDALKASNLQTTTKALTKAGAGTLEVNALNVGAATVSAGKLKISEGAIPATTASMVSSLSIAASAQLDVTNTALIVRSTDATSTARNVLWQKIIDGQNGVDGNGFTNWDGPGIISSSARANNIGLSVNLYAVGIIANHDLDSFYQYNATNGGWLNGAVTNIGVNDILIRYTYSGDSNLDGSITIADYVAIDSTYGGTSTNLGWVSGDFNNDGSIGIEDYVAIDTAYAFQTGSLSQSLLNQRLVQFGPAYVAELQSIVSSLSAVPEPTTLGALSLGAMGLLARRRRRA